jgi:hypothetical protein
MDLLFFNQINKHELYSCVLKPYKNIFCVVNLSFLKLTINPKQSDLNEIIILLAVMKVVLNKNPVLKILNFNTVKKTTIYSSFSKIKQNILLKNIIFNFIFFNQQKIPAVCLSDNIFFSSLNILSFGILGKYYRFVNNIPSFHFSFCINNTKNIEKRFFGRISRIPLFCVNSSMVEYVVANVGV